MAIPTKEQFNETLRLLDNFNSIELVKEYWKLPSKETRTREQEYKLSHIDLKLQNGAPISAYYYNFALLADFKLEKKPSALELFLERKDQLLQEKSDEIQKTPAFVWLSSQPAFKAAEKNIYGSDEDRYRHAEPLETQVSKLMSTESPDELRYAILRGLEESFGQFHNALLSKLKNYFYADFEQYLDALRKRESVAKKAKRLIDELVSLERVLTELEGKDENREVWTRPNQSQKIIRLLERTGLEVEDMILVPSFKPIRKGDATARERLMIFNLWRSFRRVLRHSSQTNFVTAISHLMYLEGIENPIGQRAIEKMIQGWRTKRRELSYGSSHHELRVERRKLKESFPISLR